MSTKKQLTEVNGWDGKSKSIKSRKSVGDNETNNQKPKWKQKQQKRIDGKQNFAAGVRATDYKQVFINIKFFTEKKLK